MALAAGSTLGSLNGKVRERLLNCSLLASCSSSTQFSTALQMLRRRGEVAEVGMKQMERRRERCIGRRGYTGY